MANNKIQVKRTTVSGRQPNTTGSYSTNSQYIAAGEFALNMADGILFSSNGSAPITVGANLVDQHITNSLTIDNDRRIYFKTINASACTFFVNQLDDNFVLYTTNTSYQPRPVFSIYANSNSSTLNFVVPTRFDANVDVITANGSVGSAGQVLTSNGSSVYWSTVSGGGSVNTSAQYIWSNTHTFQANVSFTGNNISLVSNTGSVFFGGSSDSNWRIGRSTGATTKFYYTNNSLDIIAADSNLEGVVIGKPGGNTYLETGYAGTFTQNPIYVGNSSVNVSINSTSFSGTSLTANNASYLGGNSASDLRTYSDNKAANAYSNSVSYTDGVILNVNSAITSNASAAYTNSVSYTDGKILTANAAITDNAATAYTNATIFASNASNINTGTLAEARLPYRMNQNVRTSDSVEFVGMTLTGNLVVSGNVNIIGANNLSISDNMIYLNSNNDVSSPDLGIAGNYNDGTYAHTGIFRDASDGIWKVFDNYTPEPDASVYIDTTNTSFHIANFQANTLYLGNTSTNWFVSNTSGIYHTGTVNAATFSVGSSITANSSEFVIGTAVGVKANGSFGTAGQVLTSNATTVYWANVSTSSASMIRQSYTGDGSTTEFTVSGGYTANELDVYLNGVKLLNGTDVIVTSGTTFTITPAPINGSTIYAIGYRATTITALDAVLKAGDTMTGNLVVGNTTIGLNSIIVGNSSVNVSINSTTFSGTSNNSSYLGGTAAASYQLTSGLSANIAAYLPIYAGTVNASVFTVNSVVIANSTGVYDTSDNLRSIPVFAQTAVYTLTSNDNGKTVSTTANVTVNGAVLSPNQVFTVFNNSSANITIISGTGATMYQAGTANTGNRTLQQRGVATVLMVASNTFVISGAGLA